MDASGSSLDLQTRDNAASETPMRESEPGSSLSSEGNARDESPVVARLPQAQSSTPPDMDRLTPQQSAPQLAAQHTHAQHLPADDQLQAFAQLQECVQQMSTLPVSAGSLAQAFNRNVIAFMHNSLIMQTLASQSANLRMHTLAPRTAASNSTSITVEDEEVLVRALRNGLQQNVNRRQVLETLDGVNGHAAIAWKDHYLENSTRLDNIARSPDFQAEETDSRLSHAPIKKENESIVLGPHRRLSEEIPSDRLLDREGASSQKNASSSASRTAHTSQLASKKQDIKSKPKHKTRSSSAMFKRTFNSSTLYRPGRQRVIVRSRASDVPQPPSRSPTPPSRIASSFSKRGNEYTQEDQDYFVNFVSWEANRDPTLAVPDICRKLAEKAPHHSYNSWRYWWHSHDIGDRILAAARKETFNPSNSPGVSSPPVAVKVEQRPPEPKPVPKPKPPKVDELDTLSDADTADDEANMTSSGAYCNADRRTLARFIASRDDWLELSWEQKWGEFSRKHPSRSGKAWAHFYTRNQKPIDGFARLCKQKSLQRAMKSQESPQAAATGKYIVGPAWLKRKSKGLQEAMALDENEE